MSEKSPLRQRLRQALTRFYEFVLRDPTLAPFFARTNMAGLVEKQADLFDSVFAGTNLPIEAIGARMARVHSKMVIEPRHYNRVCDYLIRALREHGAYEDEIATIGNVATLLRPYIVNAPDRSDNLREICAVHRAPVITHPLYAEIRCVEDLRTFMEHHVFAVLDFMWLLKSLQNHLTCTNELWRPTDDAGARQMINHIVAGEESDVDQHGEPWSHFEMYVNAMKEIGANTQPISEFIDAIRREQVTVKDRGQIAALLDMAGAPLAARTFVLSTLEVVSRGRPWEIAAVFTIGRENLIPDMFLPLVEQVSKRIPGGAPSLVYYFHRHIEVDGGDHGPKARTMLENLAGNDASHWNECAGSAITALRARHALWDATLAAIRGA